MFVPIFGRRNQDSREEEKMKPEQWVIEGKVGVSSRTIWAVMMGIVTEPRQCDGQYYDTPHDPDDFSRCFNLLVEFPEWTKRLNEVGKLFPKWQPFVREWSKLKEMHYQWCIDIENYRKEKIIHPQKKFKNGMYDFMHELADEGMLLDGWTKIGVGSWERK